MHLDKFCRHIEHHFVHGESGEDNQREIDELPALSYCEASILEDPFDVNEIRDDEARGIAADVGKQVMKAENLGADDQDTEIADEGDAA